MSCVSSSGTLGSRGGVDLLVESFLGTHQAPPCSSLTVCILLLSSLICSQQKQLLFISCGEPAHNGILGTEMDGQIRFSAFRRCGTFKLTF